jgi:Golgi apparatus protein 1
LLFVSADERCDAWQADVASNCKDAKSQSGEVQECLAKHRPLLSWDCQEQLFRQEVENAEDLRLSIKLFHACLADKKTVTPCLAALHFQ